jgi:hypothetical protein
MCSFASLFKDLKIIIHGFDQIRTGHIVRYKQNSRI